MTFVEKSRVIVYISSYLTLFDGRLFTNITINKKRA